MESKALIEAIDRELEVLLQGDDVLSKASHYAVFPAGKRLRPLLALTVAEDLGCDPDHYIPAACALELIHTSSLIHDDLPCMDNDDLRRGRPTVHKAFSESTALLTGDLLIAEAFTPIFSQRDLSADQRATLCRSISNAYRSLCIGQQMDLCGPSEFEAVLQTHALKTGGLFRACFEFGAVFAKADQKIFEHCGRVGEQFGVLFQILDDSIDDVHLVGRLETARLVRSFESVISPGVPCTLLKTNALVRSILEPLSLK